MTPQQIVGLAARLLAIWIALSTFLFTDRALEAFNVEGAGALAGYWLIFAALWWIAALLLWFFPMTIGHALVPRTKFQDTLRLPGQQAVVVACVTLGLIVVAWRALPVLASWLASVIWWVSVGQQVSDMDPATHLSGLTGLIQLVVGLLLMFKAHALTAWLMPAPDAARDPPDAAETPET
jgi:hypothetical protein